MMNKEVLNAKLKEEMRHIPEDGDNQNCLRLIYSLERRNHLAIKGKDYSPGESMRQAMIFCRLHGHENANYDTEFFLCK